MQIGDVIVLAFLTIAFMVGLFVLEANGLA